jgi:hypothetical protein
VRPGGRILAGGSAVLLGGAAGLLGSFTHAVSAGGAPVGLVTALALSVAVIAAAGLATRGRLAAGLAAAGWLIAVLVLASRRPEGDLVVPGTVLGSCWLLVGSLLAGAAVAWPYAVRPGDEPVRRHLGASSAERPGDR